MKSGVYLLFQYFGSSYGTYISAEIHIPQGYIRTTHKVDKITSRFRIPGIFRDHPTVIPDITSFFGNFIIQIHSYRKAESKRLAKNMKETFESKYDKHQPNRGFSGTVSGRNLYVLAHTTPASVFVELGNIQNTFDQRRLVIPSNRQALAKWLMEGFIKDYK